MTRFSALLAAGLAVLDSAYAVQSEGNSFSTTSTHPSHVHHSSSSRPLLHVHSNSTTPSTTASRTPHVVVPPKTTKNQPHTKHTSATDETLRTTTKPKTKTKTTDTAAHKTNTSKETSHSGDKTAATTPSTHHTSHSEKTSHDGDKTTHATHTTHHTTHSEHTTAPSTTHDPAYLTAPFVVHSITVPAQTALQTGDFSTKTLSDRTGPPNSYSATTVTGDDHHPTILPVWFNKKGHPIVVSPVKVDGPPGVIPPPKGLPKLNIGPNGNPTPAPSDDDPPETNKPKTTKKKTDKHTTKTHDKTTSEKTSEKTTSTSSKTTSTSSETTTTTSTSTPTGKSTRYLILPKKDSTQKQHKQITSKLIDMVGKSKVNTKSYKTDGLGFWSATLNSTQVDEIKKESIIEGVVKDELLIVEGVGKDDKKTKRTDGIESFRNLIRSAKFWKRNNSPERKQAPHELALVSQPKDNNIPMSIWGKTYQYDASAGKGITVYVMDTGASPENNEYKNMPGEKSWIYSGAIGAKHHDTDKDDKFGHGTCVLSKLAGPKYGVAKNVNIVVVKMQAERPKDGNGKAIFAIYGATYLDAIRSVIDDIKSNKRQGKAVINMSFGFPIADSFFARYAELTTETITGLDVPIIVAAGNEADNGIKEVNSYPALWAKKNDGIIVVGSTSDNNQISSFSQDGPLVTVYAPGDGIICAAPGNADAHQHQRGSSFAAPAVAGLTAYMMGLPSSVGHLPAVGNGKIPGYMRQQLKDHASWARVNGGPNILWNGQDTTTSWDNQGCGSGSGSGGHIIKRNDGKCSISATTGTKTGSATNTATHHSTKSTKTSHTTTKGTTTSHHHTTTTNKTHATTTTTPTKSTSTPASLWCAPTHKASPTIPADKAQNKVESFCKGILKEAGAINGFYPMSKVYKKYAKTYKLGDVDTTFNLNWVSGRQAGINVKMCKDMLSEVIKDCSGGRGGGIPHDGIPTGVASFNVTLGKDG